MPVLDVPRRSFVAQVMGMPVSVLVRGDDARTRRVAALVAALHDELREVDARFNTYRPDSEVSRLRRGALALADTHPDVRHVLELCEQARVATDGWFDASLPDDTGVRRLDPSGFVKGWAVQRASRRLHELVGHDWLVNAGGDLLGSAQHGAPWRIGIENPRDRSRMLAVVPLRQGAVATSGSAARGAHVLVPATGQPAERLLSATVTGPQLQVADVEATALFAEGTAGVDRLRTRGGYEALLVCADGSVLRTPAFPTA